MLFTISTTRYPATDLGYLLHKHPAKVQSVDLAKGVARIFYTEAKPERCTMAMAIEVDPVALVRNSGGAVNDAFALGQYVNDKPYAASSIFSNALSKCFASAMNGRCKDKPELVDEAIPFEVKIAVLPVRGGEGLLKQLLEPLGYTVQVLRHVLDDKFATWGDSRYYTVTLSNTCKLSDLLSHLYVLIPVLDNNKHYWIGESEVDKLLDKGTGWLETHPAKDLITKRYLRNLGALTKRALMALNIDEGIVDDTEIEEAETTITEKKVRLHDHRLEVVKQELHNTGARRVLDLGCGEGKLLRLLLNDKQFEFMLGMDVSLRSLEIANERLNLDKLSPKYRQRIQLIQSALTYRDKRLTGFDAAALVEVIEHLDEPRLKALTANVFGYAKPAYVIITTPNKEYNSLYEKMGDNDMRHSDHRFEWTRAEFESWCTGVAEQFGYSVSFKPVGDEDLTVGAPTQMGIFSLKNNEQ